MSLKNLLKDLKKNGRRDRDTSRNAAKKLGEVGDESVIPALKEASQNHKDKETRKLAQQSLKKLQTSLNETTATSGSESYEITNATEVEAPSEDALLIVVEETQEGAIRRDGTPTSEEEDGDAHKELTATGILKIKNTGEEDRIWDIDVRIEDNGLSDLQQNFHINMLDKAEEWIHPYSIKNLPESLPLNFIEVIDTVGGEEPSSIMVFGQEMETKISYEVQAVKDLFEIFFEKELPNHFNHLKIASSSSGNPVINEDKLEWKIPMLKEGETASLQLTCLVKAEDTETKRTGKGKLTFKSKTEGAFSNMDVDGADGLVKNYSYVESDELEDQPDNWNCKLVLENPSEFPIELRDILIKRGEYVYISEEYEEADAIIVPPKQSWESKTFTLFSEDIPSFEKNVSFTVKPEIMYVASSTLDVADSEMRVANLKASKSYNLDKIPSFRETEVPTILEFSNVGSLGFKSVTVKDIIPPKFKVVDPESVKVYFGKKQIEETEYSITYEPGAAIQVPEDAELPAIDHGSFDDTEYPEQTLVINIDKELEPNQKIKVEYTPVAQKPEPNRNFSGSAEISADLKEPGPPLKIFVSDWLSANVIQVVHTRKAITVGKTVLPGAEPGLFEIELTFKNRGDTALEGIKVKDIIPEGFTLVDDAFKDLAEDEATPEGVVRTWTFETVEKDQQISITYNLQGEGDEFHIGQAQKTIG